MYWTNNPYVLPAFLAAIVSALLGIFTWSRRPVLGAKPGALVMFAVSVWAIGYAFELTSSELPNLIFWSQFEYLGIVSTPLAWFCFAMEYTGRGRLLTHRNLALLAVVPIVALVLVWTNDIHHFFWSGFELDRGLGFVMSNPIHGPGFFIHWVFAYALMLAGTLLLLRWSAQAASLYRMQAAVVLVAALLPWFGNYLYVSGLSPFPRLDLTPLCLTLSGAALVWGLFRYRLLDIVPIARDTVIERLTDVVIVLDAQKRIVDANTSAQAVLACPIKEAIGKPAAEILSHHRELARRLQEKPGTGAEIPLEIEGRARYMDCNITPVQYQPGVAPGEVVVLRDITERRQLQQNLSYARAEAEQRAAELSTILDSIPEMVTFFDPSGRCVRANAAALRYLGADVVGMEWEGQAQLIQRFQIRRHDGHPVDNDNRPSALVLRGEKPVTGIGIWTDAAGNESFFETFAAPVLLDDKIAGTVSVHHDLTNLTRAEDALRASEARYRALVQMSPEAILIDRDNHVVFANPAAVDLFGATNPEQLLGRSRFDLFHPDCHPLMHTRLMRILRGEAVPIVEERILRFDGTSREVEAVASAFSDQEGQAIQVILRDITARKQMERALQQHAEQMLSLYQIGLSIAATLERDQVLSVLEEQIRKLLDPDVCHLAVYDEDTHICEFPVSWDRQGQRPVPSRDLREWPGIIGEVITGRCTLHIPDTLTPEAEAAHQFIRAPGAPTRTYVGVPMIAHGRALGVISILSYQPDAYTADQIRLLEMIAIQAAIAIENARLYGRAQREIDDRKRAEGDVRQLNIKLERRVAERTAQLVAANEALKESEEGYRAYTEFAPDAIITSDGQGRIQSWNQAAENLFGYSADEMLGGPVSTVVPEPYWNVHRAGPQAPSHPTPVEIVATRKDGNQFPAELSIGTWMSKGGNYATVIIRDISRRKRVELELERQHAKIQRRLLEVERLAEQNAADKGSGTV